MNKRPAYSLIFAFIMMTVIMIIATTTIQDTRNKIQLFESLEASSQARLAAESAAELGIVALKESNGYNAEVEEDGFCLPYSTRADCQGEGSYTIYPYAMQNSEEADGYYYLPIPGTGDAATSDECSITDSDLSKDHSCNWNKLTAEKSVTIPMYHDDGTGSLIFPDSMGLNGWYLRLRTPCENGSLESDCDGGDRYEISDSTRTATNFFETPDNPSIILWGFTADISGISSSLIPNDALDSSNDEARNYVTNTEIYEDIIGVDPYNTQLAVDNVVLLASAAFLPGYVTIYDFITTSGYSDLIFNMSVVDALEDINDSTIPYLEYQIVLDSSSYPPMSTKAEVIGKGYYTINDVTYFHPYSVSTNNTDTVTSLYTLSN